MNRPSVLLRRSKIHNMGMFAGEPIPAGARIIEYVGERITKAEAERRALSRMHGSHPCGTQGAVYLFELNKRHDIDGNNSHNIARYINHSCEPNCEAVNVHGHIWIVAAKDIRSGEEITYNYGYRFDSYQDHPCRCGSRRCVGFILAERYWRRLRKELGSRRNGKREKAV